jgi:hypothetical protein
MLNYDLAERRELSKRDINKLEALHNIMDDLCAQQNWAHDKFGTSKKDKKKLRRVVRQLEFMMQLLWSFPEDKTRHYHWKRFDCLNKVDCTGTRAI